MGLGSYCFVGGFGFMAGFHKGGVLRVAVWRVWDYVVCGDERVVHVG